MCQSCRPLCSGGTMRIYFPSVGRCLYSSRARFVAAALVFAVPGGASAATLVDIATDATDPLNLVHGAKHRGEPGRPNEDCGGHVFGELGPECHGARLEIG